MGSGESVAEACAREVWKETGLRVHMGRLIGVYSNPNRLVEYADGNRFQMVGLYFEVCCIDGVLNLSDETTAAGYFTLDEIAMMEVMEHHYERIRDAFGMHIAPVIR